VLTVEDIAIAIAAAPVRPIDFVAAPRNAAVAMILCQGEVELEACFIQRAERAGDPWSGQVAFPGGRAAQGDGSAAAVAERETREEVGLVIGPEHRIGALPPRHLTRHGSGMTLSPFVYHLSGRAGPDAPQRRARPRAPREVASVFWVPLAHLFDEAAVTTLTYPPGENGGQFPGIGFGERVIWGLTLQVLGTFAEILGRRIPALTGH